MSYSVSAAQTVHMLGNWKHEGPTYLDLANALRRLVVDGRLPLGSRVPAERILARRLRISRNTVSAAYRHLRDIGYLASKRGAGSFTTVPKKTNAITPNGFRSNSGELDDIDFTTASPVTVPPLLHEATRRACDDLTAMTGDTGHDLQGVLRLRQALADRFTAQGTPTGPDEIMVTAGARHAWRLLLRLLSRTHDQVLVDSPTFPGAVDAIRGLDRRVLSVGLADGGWAVDLIESALHQARPALAYLVPDFHTPTGLSMPLDARERIAQAARRCGTHLVFDETTADLALDGTPDSRRRHRPRDVIVVGSLSKVCWAGLRIGWLRAPSALISQLIGLRARIDAANPILPQLVACHLFEAYDELLTERRRTLAAARDVLVRALRARIPEWTFIVPAGGVSLWVDLGAAVATRVALAARSSGLLVLPGPRFSPDGVLENHLWMPFSRDETTTADAVARLAGAFAEVVTTKTAAWSAGVPDQCTAPDAELSRLTGHAIG